MDKNLSFKSLVFSLFFLIASNPYAQALAQNSVRSDHVQVSLIAISKTQVGVHYKLDPEWHVYWKNPGDSGAAPKFELTGAALKKIEWPYPHRLPVQELTNYGYEGEVLIPLEIETEPGAKEIIFNLEWLVCKVECVPGFAEFKLTLDSIKPSATETALYNKFKSHVPVNSDKNWSAEFVEANNTAVTFLLNTVSNDIFGEIQNLFIYPENGERFKTQNPVIELVDKGYKVTVPLSDNAALGKSSGPDHFTVVLNYNSGESHSFTVAVENKVSASALLYGMLFAFIGGLILNLMPCVFPILSLKALSFMNDDEKKIRQSAWTYSAGVLLTFILVGGALTILRITGSSIGWGFQLQSAWVVYLLTLLFFIMALNFWGFFEIGNSLANSANKAGSKGFFSGSFGTGVLAVIVASPCTAPFMGSALGLTLLLPPLLSLLIFFSLGAGMALPMILISYFPRLIRMLPKSGAWMETLKKFMAFPMLLTCLWLLWVLDTQKGSSAIFVVLLSFVLVTLFIWLITISKKKHWQIIFTLLLLVTPAFALKEIIQTTHVSAAAYHEDRAWQPFDPAVIEQKRETQKIFVDFTASWCITCQVNKKNVLRTEEIQKLFKDNDVFLVEADWTSQDARITQALSQFGRNSVPLYVYYDKKNKPEILPQLLTKQMIINLFNKGE